MAGVSVFLKQKLPDTIFCRIKERLQDLYVDLGTRDTLKEKMGLCNQNLANTGYSIQIEYEEMYCAGAYFISIEHL